MKIVVNSPAPARFQRSAAHHSFQYFSFTQFPLFLRSLLFPATGPATASFNGPHIKSKFLAIITLLATYGPAPAAVRSGNATVEWISTSNTVEPGLPTQTAIRMVLDPSWHTYWLNPGEGGMQTSVKWELPPGWTTGGLKYPVPKRFISGGLAGYGYQNTVIFPLSLVPPADFTGNTLLKGKISWLTCDDATCVPGNAEISLTLTAGTPAPSPDTAAIANALTLLPVENPAVVLDVAEARGNLQLTIRLAVPEIINPATSQVFPLNHHAVNETTPIQFVKSGAVWTASVPKSEYTTEPLRTLTLLLADHDMPGAISTTWIKK